jgi:hypothetical protein
VALATGPNDEEEDEEALCDSFFQVIKFVY